MVDTAQVQLLAAKLLSASAAECVTFPLDTIKTRLQLQGELMSGTSAGRVGASRLAMTLVQKEGARTLYVGLSPAVIRHFFYTGTRLSLYEYLRNAFEPAATLSASSSIPQQPGSSAGFVSKLGMGLTSGAVGQLVAVPADLCKVRLQADRRSVATGQQSQPSYKGMLHVLRTIVAADGMAGLWRGASPAVQRAALVNLGELATYDAAKQAVLQHGIASSDGLWCHTASSMCSGFVASVVSTPADVVKTRLMSQDPHAPHYKGTMDCLVQTVRAEGLAGLYKGFLPTWARLGPWQLVFWVSYERLRSLQGLSGF